MAAIDIDITIVTYNSAKLLPRLLVSLSTQTFDHRRVALSFTDNGSSDDSHALLAGWRDEHGAEFGAIHLSRGANDGFGAGHNRAAAATSAPFLFILNPDTELSSDTLARLHATAVADDARVAAWEARQLPYEHPKDYDPVSGDTPWCSGACVMVRRAAFDAVGGFDPAFFLYCEDVDLSWRLRAAGWRLRYVPQASLRHFSYATPGEVKPAQLYGSTLGNLYLRTRFGTRRDLLQGLSAYADLLQAPPPLPDARAQLWRNLATYARNAPHFRASGTTFRFFGWDYAARRTGDFYESIVAASLPRRPKVSIVVRSIGRVPLLRRALATIAAQTYAPIEVVLVEDGSERGRALLAEFPALDVVYLSLSPRVGRSAAGNAALTRASGELCNFLDEDDELYADHVEQLVAALVTRGGRAAHASAFEVPSQVQNDVVIAEGDPSVVFRGPLNRVRMTGHNQLPIQSVMFERSLFTELGGFDEALDAQEDWHLWARYLSVSGNFTFVDKTTSRYRVPMEHARSEERREWLEGERRKVQGMVSALRLDSSFAELYDELERVRQGDRDVESRKSRPLSWWLAQTARAAYHDARIAVRELLFPDRPRR